MFQFLIGWLQTDTLSENFSAKNPVSIPHRLATNSVCVILLNNLTVVSIPHRLATNPRHSLVYKRK